MNYYEVWVASQRYHGDKSLTYASEDALSTGSVVVAPLQRQNVLGVVIKKTNKPSFATKPVFKPIPAATLPPELLRLIDWMKDYYPAPLGQLLGLLLPNTLLTSPRKPPQPTTKEHTDKSLPPLTAQQSSVVTDFLASKQRMHLLHGDTGTGKTRVYIELIKHQLDNQKSAILLTPEIGLTPQLITEVASVFPGRVVVLHSNLSPAKRRDTWLTIASADQPLVVIGPRSALFAPLQNVGVIIVDEAHDSAYKQEQAPYYLTQRVAAKLAELHHAKVLLGTATPTIADYYTLEAKKLPILTMDKTAIEHNHQTSTEVVNLRDRNQFTTSPWLSQTLLENLTRCLSSGSQALIFLNRRGTARLVLCQQCDWQALCPRCDLPLTYHGDHHVMRCHTCGFTDKAPSSCPDCKSAEITFKSIGTKSLVDEISRLYPKVRIMRFDGDNKKSESLEENYQDIRDGKVDILVGTQLLVKGLDLPGLGLVGAVMADTALYFPDFTAEERTYQLISQVIGRANRGHRDSTIVIQTYNPDNSALQAAITKNYRSFYEDQLVEREKFKFPPFRHLLKVRVERSTQKGAERAAQTTLTKILDLKLPVETQGPTPAFIEKAHNRYRWQIIIKAKQRQHLTHIISSLPANTTYDIDPTNLL